MVLLLTVVLAVSAHKADRHKRENWKLQEELRVQVNEVTRLASILERKQQHTQASLEKEKQKPLNYIDAEEIVCGTCLSSLQSCTCGDNNIAGSGTHGTVYISRYAGITVAVKARASACDNAIQGPSLGTTIDSDELSEEHDVTGAATNDPDNISMFERESFLAEMDAISRLRHPNIIMFLGVVDHPTCPSIVTEFADRGSLYDFLAGVRAQQSQEGGMSRDDGLGWKMLRCRAKGHGANPRMYV